LPQIEEDLYMARGGSRRYSDEFKADAVALVRKSGRPVRQVAQELGVDDSTLSYWVHTADASLSDEERSDLEEQRRLRKRIKELEEEVEILKRFTAYWVKETGK
jgi:transposase